MRSAVHVRRLASVGALLAALLVAPAAAAPGRSSAFDATAYLQVDVGSPLSPLQFDLSTAPAAGVPSRLEVDVPAGYSLDLSATRSTEIGLVVVSITDSGDAGGISFRAVNLAVADPTAYTADPSAQACAPGSHAALWSGTAAIAGQTLRLLVFVDPAAGGGDTLLVCPSGLTGTGELGVDLSFSVGARLSVPKGAGRYVWRALVTPRSGNAYELRAPAVLPSSLTLKGVYDAKRGVARLSGRLTAGGRPLAREDIFLNVQIGDTTSGDNDPAATTSADGSFSIRRAVRKTSDYIVYAAPLPRACTTPSTAPGGCLSETPVAPAPAFATIGLPRRGDPARAYTHRGQSLAARELLAPADLAADFSAIGPSIHTCDGSHPSEARLSLAGEARSPLYGAIVGGSIVDPASLRLLEVGVTTRVYRSRADARAALAAEATASGARCRLNGLPGSVAKATRAFPEHPATVRAFLDTAVEDGVKVTLDLVFIQRGRSVATLTVGGVGTPSRPLALALERKIATRLR